MRLFSTEQVSKYHPDKYADQISDAILTAYLAKDRYARVACETMVKGDVVVLAGEITSSAEVDRREIVRKVAKKLGYTADCILEFITEQSREIADAVDQDAEIGAGDQGMMVGYATRETPAYLPYGFVLANKIIKAIESDIESNPRSILRGDAKVQVTVDLDAPANFSSVHTVLISVCHHAYAGMLRLELNDIKRYVLILLDKNKITLPESAKILINPAGLWTVGGPTADSGLTGRKIVCDQYGGYVPVGGGAFSGKDPSKVDRSGAYAARSLAVKLLKANPQVQWVEVQVAYAIGVAHPVSVSVKSDRPSENAKLAAQVDYDALTPRQIIKSLKLLEGTINYERLAEGCHYYGHSW